MPDMTETVFLLDRAWVDGACVDDVAVRVRDGTIGSVETDAPRVDDAVRLRGFTIPGLVNAHSHAFQRLLRGRTEATDGNFWSWRDQMYQLAERLDPDTFEEVATAVFGEMLMAGVTTVGEFHYVHHPGEGGSYADPNAMGEALLAAAAATGIRITLLDTCYLRSGFDTAPVGVQKRFSDGHAETWVERVSGLKGGPAAKVGAAVHSVRAVDPASARTVGEWAEHNDAPLHFHLSEQIAENEACVASTGRTPTEVMAEAGVLGRNSTAVHATHLTATDLDLIVSSGTGACICPTTERALADGIGPVAQLRDAAVPLSVGSDSQTTIDLFEEARLLDLHERFVAHRRGTWSAPHLLAAATNGGARSLGWDNTGIAAGAMADFTVIDMESVRTAGIADPVAAAVYAATASDVTDVVVGGEVVVRDRHHGAIEDVPRALENAAGRVLRDG